MSMRPSPSMSPIAIEKPMNPLEFIEALRSDQISWPVRPSSTRSTPLSRGLLVGATAPATKITLGGSDSSIWPSQLASTTRPTVGVDHTSVKLGNSLAVGPHDHLATASSGPVGGWYSQRSTQPASG